MASVNGFYVWAGLLGFDKRIDSATLLGQEAWIPGSRAGLRNRLGYLAG